VDLLEALEDPGDVGESLDRIVVDLVSQLTSLSFYLSDDRLNPQVAVPAPQAGSPLHPLSADSMDTIP
jgi:hypothetical protein